MSWLKNLFSRRQIYSELSDEIREHLAEKTDELIASGMSPEEAAYSARREFGNATLIEEEGRNAWRWLSFENFLADVRHALRMFRRNPVFTVVGLLTIAIGIGANAAVFSVVNSVLLKPLNYPRSQEIVSLHQLAPGAAGLADFRNGLLLSPSMYFTYSEQNRSFASVGVWIPGTANVTGLAEPEQIRAVYLTDGVMNLALLRRASRSEPRFTLEEVAAGFTVEEVLSLTGMAVDVADQVGVMQENWI